MQMDIKALNYPASVRVMLRHCEGYQRNSKNFDQSRTDLNHRYYVPDAEGTYRLYEQIISGLDYKQDEYKKTPIPCYMMTVYQPEALRGDGGWFDRAVDLFDLHISQMSDFRVLNAYTHFDELLIDPLTGNAYPKLPHLHFFAMGVSRHSPAITMDNIQLKFFLLALDDYSNGNFLDTRDRRTYRKALRPL